MRYCHFGVSPVNYSDSDSGPTLVNFADIILSSTFLGLLGLSFLFILCLCFQVLQVKDRERNKEQQSIVHTEHDHVDHPLKYQNIIETSLWKITTLNLYLFIVKRFD